VSRLHASIVLENDRFVLYDKQSKFGTLVKLTNNLPIDDNKRAFQIGRTVLTFIMKKEKLEPKETKVTKDTMERLDNKDTLEPMVPSHKLQPTQSALKEPAFTAQLDNKLLEEVAHALTLTSLDLNQSTTVTLKDGW